MGNGLITGSGFVGKESCTSIGVPMPKDTNSVDVYAQKRIGNDIQRKPRVIIQDCFPEPKRMGNAKPVGIIFENGPKIGRTESGGGRIPEHGCFPSGKLDTVEPGFEPNSEPDGMGRPFDLKRDGKILDMGLNPQRDTVEPGFEPNMDPEGMGRPFDLKRDGKILDTGSNPRHRSGEGWSKVEPSEIPVEIREKVVEMRREGHQEGMIMVQGGCGPAGRSERAHEGFAIGRAIDSTEKPQEGRGLAHRIHSATPLQRALGADMQEKVIELHGNPVQPLEGGILQGRGVKQF